MKIKRYFVHFKAGFFCSVDASSFFEKGNMLVFRMDSVPSAEFFIKSVDYVDQVPLLSESFRVWG